MALSVNTNVGALNALASASSTNKNLETSMARLASGKRINSAADDAAGMAIASRLTSEIRGTNMAIRNASDGQSMLNTAEGASNEVVNILQRMRELANQASNDTNNASDRTNIANEITQLNTEINRIANTTSWAGVKLLDGSVPATGLNIQVGSNTSSYDKLTVAINGISSGDLGLVGSAAAVVVSGVKELGITSASVGMTNSSGVFTLSASLAAASIAVNVNKADGTVVHVSYAITGAQSGASGQVRDAVARQFADVFNAAATGFTATASTDNSGKITIKKGSLDVSTATAALSTVTALDTALNTVNTQRAKLGATSNRLDSTISNLTNIQSNLEVGRGRIEDADFAGESTSMAKSQILQQAATAMLAQANASKQGVLQLLQR
jgi:flagellin